ncbi:MAG: multicopper oxidase domain-containing protein, partial [Candidatus Dormibacteraeota bacterium]|nr:multicopper oxidase domain-containing protein [Candidatus Dormibacteraeota bacterium]
DPANLVPIGPQADPILEMDRIAWTSAGFAEGDRKKGDRVPPGGLFTYTWQTLGWPTTAGVWLYHDHSICDDRSVNLGAIGIIVVHNLEKDDPGEVIVDNNDFPGGSPNGSPVNAGNYRTPPRGKAQYLQLYHSLKGAGMLVNGRKYLGQTPTMVAGPNTKMRFGVVGMGSDTHTFHLHGHRWVIPAAAGTALNANNAIPNPLINISSQFEDTRVFGPTNSFAFTVQEGSSFMRAEPPQGEWHMHCHVLAHMTEGMMGSLLVVNDGDPVVALPQGVPCPEDMSTGGGGDGGNMPAMVSIEDNLFNPANVTIAHGTAVRWTNNGANMQHTTTSNGHAGGPCTPISAEDWDSGTIAHGSTFDHTFPTAGTFNYHCDVHGCGMAGTVTVT